MQRRPFFYGIASTALEMAYMVTAMQNAQCVDRMYREHGSWLQSWLARQRWTVSSAEDIAADVFVSLLSMPALASVREPRAMMTTIAKRAIYDARRRKRQQISYEVAVSAIPEALQASPEDHLMVVQALRQIDGALGSLSVKARKAFLMSQIDGLPNKEIAAALDVSLSAVSKYMTQGFSAVYATRVQNT